MIPKRVVPADLNDIIDGKTPLHGDQNVFIFACQRPRRRL